METFITLLSYLAMFMLGGIAVFGLLILDYNHNQKKKTRQIVKDAGCATEEERQDKMENTILSYAS